LKQSLLVVSFLSAILSGCDGQTIKATNGELPSETIPYLQPYLGTYSATRVIGLQSYHSGTVTLSLEGTKVVAEMTFDLLGNGCDAKLGELEEVTVQSEQGATPTLGEASFALDPGTCGSTFADDPVTFTFDSGNFEMHYSRHKMGRPIDMLEYVLNR
jgi:hypothetical protein